MKKWQIFGTLVILLALVLSQVQVASAATTKFKILNKTGGSTIITLTGPKIYTFTLKIGATNVEMEKGTYRYSYYACGKTNTGTMIVKAPSDVFEMPKCPASAAAAVGATGSAGTIQVRLNNRTGVKLYITLRGPATYTLELLSGLNKVQIIKGTYTYSYSACGKTNTGTFKANSTNAELKLDKCPTTGSGTEKSAKTIKIKVRNDTGGVMTLYMNGPQNYTFTLSPGVTLIYVVKGEYTYYVYSVCGSTSGTKKFTPGLEWFWWCN